MPGRRQCAAIKQIASSGNEHCMIPESRILEDLAHRAFAAMGNVPVGVPVGLQLVACIVVHAHAVRPHT
eukprot:4713866-Karenia_brevis.AAC.1